MKRLIPLLAVVLLAAGCGNSGTSGSQQGQAQGENAGANLTLDNDAQKRSYALGMDIGNSLKNVPIELKLDYLSQGIRDTVSGNKPKLSDKELKATMQDMVKEMQSAKKKKDSKLAKTNLKKSQEFLAKNKKKDGVKVTDSGLQYKVIKEGSGPKPSADDSVKVHYEGKLIDGTVFDSSRKRGEPVTFPVNAVIPGWTEALQMMKEGAHYKLYIPSKLAYGKRGAGNKIGPNQALVFDVELLKVLPKKASDDAESGKGAKDDN